MKQSYFDSAEFAARRAQVKSAMAKAGLDLLICADPANMDYLTGFKGWSFYVPQCVLLHAEDEHPTWIGRGQDGAAARLTTTLPDDHILPYPDDYVQNRTKHPMHFVADQVRKRGWQRARIGLEMDAYYFSGRAADTIRAALPDARFSDCDHLVNWVRLVKSEAELRYIREAAVLVTGAMRVGIDGIQPGRRQCDVVAEIYQAQIRGTPQFGGDYTALCPLLPSGEKTATPHLTWSDDPFVKGEPTIIELAGSRLGYHCPIARTVFLGTPPAKLAKTADVVIEGLHAALGAAKPGALAEEVEAAWRGAVAKHGVRKESRIGYPFGLAYPPDWGEHTASFRPGDKTELRANMTFHCIPGIWEDGWGFEVSAAFVVTAAGGKPFYDFPERLTVKP